VKGYVYKRCPCGTMRDGQGKRINCRKKHGSWSYVHELPAAADGRRRQTTKGGFATEREAQNALTESLDKVNRVGYVEPARLKVGDYLDQWLAGQGWAACIHSTLVSRAHRPLLASRSRLYPTERPP
jgi:hypothetical protein